MKKRFLILIAVIVLIPVLTFASVLTPKYATLINATGHKIVIKVGDKIPTGYILFSSEKLGAAQINGFKSVSATTTTTAAGLASVVLLPNSGRHYALLTNTSATIAYLAFNATSSPNATPILSDSNYIVPLAASGGTYTINLDNLYLGQIIATSSAAVSIRAMEAK